MKKTKLKYIERQLMKHLIHYSFIGKGCGYKCEKRPRYRWFNSLEINEDEVYRLTIDEASRVILKNKDDIINAKCREKVKN